MTTITEKTLIPISLVLVIVGGSSWLTTIYSQVKQIAQEQEEYTTNLRKIDQRLSRIEGKLGVGLAASREGGTVDDRGYRE